MHVLVTGGSGFIGRHVVARLRARGDTVTVVDRNRFPDSDVAQVLGDLRDRAVIDKAVTAELDGVVHLAAVTSVLQSVKDPDAVFATNVIVTEMLLERCRELDVARFVFASTNAVVGDVGAAVIDETIALRPLTPYGATKAAGEMLLSSYSASYGLRTVALRFTNVYGAGMQVKDSVIARLMRAAMSHGGIEIYGDGEQLRDYLYVTDAASALERALGLDESTVLTIGAGESVSLNELHQLCSEISGVEIGKSHVPGKPGEMPAVVVSTKRAASLGFEPSYSLRAGLEETWRDFSASPA